jgi:hypothetical protein
MPAAQPSFALWIARASAGSMRADAVIASASSTVNRKRFPLDAGQPLLADQARHLRGRRFARQEHEAHAERNFAQSFGERESPRDIGLRLVKIVDDEQRARRKEGEELAQKTPGERGQVAAVVRGEHRQRGGVLRAPYRQIGGGSAQIVKERGRVGVALVGLEPDAGQLARLDVARDEGRLAGARRTRNPDDRMRAMLVEQPEQALALLDVV